MQESQCVGGTTEKMWGGQYHQQDRVYLMGDIALCIPSQIPGGRDKNNPSFRGKSNENFEQRLEINPEGIANSLTTVQKDNMVLIRQATKDGLIPCKIGGGAWT